MLNAQQKAELRGYAIVNGRTWKSKLRKAWMAASAPGILQELRNASYFGPAGLERVKLADLEPAADLEPPADAFLAQIDAAKAAHPEFLLLFKVGDFYEAFREDAATLARVCNLTLTARRGVPMAGLAYHMLERSLRTLMVAGLRVAVCEQVPEAPAGRTVERIVGPGSLTS